MQSTWTGEPGRLTRDARRRFSCESNSVEARVRIPLISLELASAASDVLRRPHSDFLTAQGELRFGLTKMFFPLPPTATHGFLVSKWTRYDPQWLR